MTLRTLILGSGPAAAGAALALTARGDCAVTVVDAGVQLDDPNASALQRVSAVEPAMWSSADLELLGAQPQPASGGALPEKLAYGSDYPFRDAGQLLGVSAAPGVHRALVSAAYGGFSAVWGAQILPFPRSGFDGWPLGTADLDPHYRAVLRRIPFAAETDDLAAILPLHVDAQPLPPASPRAELILDAYARHRQRLRDLGLRVGRARLALRARDCRLVGMCMTGCPYSLVYSAAHTFDELRRAGKVAYRGGLLVTGLAETADQAVVTARELGTGATRTFEADRVFVACGAVGTTRLVLSSRCRPGQEVLLSESAQFVVPLVSRRPTATDPRHDASFSLGQVSATLPWDAFSDHPAHLQIYTYNPAFLEALPAALRREPTASRLLSRLSVVLGYLPSSVSSRIRLRVDEGAPGRLAPMYVSSDENPEARRALRSVLKRMLRAAPLLDLWPILPRVVLSSPGKSYHWGGAFPHARRPVSGLETDVLGRLPEWRRIHLVDASVLPSIAATTFTLTEMANAHRIATATMHAAGTQP